MGARCIMASQSMVVCAPAPVAAAVATGQTRCSLASSSAAAVNARWGHRVSLKARFTHSLLQHGPSGPQVARQIAVAQLTDFSVQESAKFREGLLKQLEANPTTASDKVKIADVCTKIFGDYLDKYDGSLSPEPFGAMKQALDGQNLPDSVSVVCAALGWSRGHLHHDWKMQEKK